MAGIVRSSPSSDNSGIIVIEETLTLTSLSLRLVLGYCLLVALGGYEIARVDDF